MQNQSPGGRSNAAYWIRLALYLASAFAVGAMSTRLKVYGSVVYVDASAVFLVAVFALGIFIERKLTKRIG